MTDRPSVSAAIRAAMLTAAPDAKVMATRAVARDWAAGRLAFRFEATMPDMPARPAAPSCCRPTPCPSADAADRNAAASPCSTRWRISNSSRSIWRWTRPGGSARSAGRSSSPDWLSVAADEAMHHALLARRLRTLGSFYGAMPAHDGLWDAARETAHDIAARLAVVHGAGSARAGRDADDHRTLHRRWR
jgi:uncharacterized ferritin-like protein (DUF455 family)